jgi:hypothetical protein
VALAVQSRQKKSTWVGLGSYSTVPLVDARDAAFLARKQLRHGIDPSQQKRAALADKKAESCTFKAVAQEYIQEHKAGWRNEKHADQWTSTLNAYAYSVLDDLAGCGNLSFGLADNVIR